MALSAGARDVFEMGSGFGYSTLFFAHAVGDPGRVVHTERDPKLTEEARALLGRANVASRVTFELGNALDVITRYAGPFDIIFIDVDKEQYPAALELARVRVRPGRYIIADNVLWSGKVAADPNTDDAATRAIDKFNRIAADAPDLLTTVLPLRDGVSLHYKLGETPRRVRSATTPGVPAIGTTPSGVPAIRTATPAYGNSPRPPHHPLDGRPPHHPLGRRPGPEDPPTGDPRSKSSSWPARIPICPSSPWGSSSSTAIASS